MEERESGRESGRERVEERERERESTSPEAFPLRALACVSSHSSEHAAWKTALEFSKVPFGELVSAEYPS